MPVADGTGEIVEIGEDVTQFQAGDRVSGAYFPGWINGDVAPEKVAASPGAGALDGVRADYFTLPEAATVAIPEHLTDAEAATLGCAGVTAWNALFASHQLTPGETVLRGTGEVSLFALQFAKLAGARVIITSSSDAKLERARQLGADDMINYQTTGDWPGEVLALTGGRGVDVAVDTVGGSELDRVVRSVRLGITGGAAARPEKSRTSAAGMPDFGGKVPAGSIAVAPFREKVDS